MKGVYDICDGCLWKLISNTQTSLPYVSNVLRCVCVYLLCMLCVYIFFSFLLLALYVNGCNLVLEYFNVFWPS